MVPSRRLAMRDTVGPGVSAPALLLTTDKIAVSHRSRDAYVSLLTELPEQPVQFRGQAVVGVVMVPVRARKSGGGGGSRVVAWPPGRPQGRVRRCVGAVAAARPGGRGGRAGRGVAAGS